MTEPLPVILVVDDTPAKRYVLASWLRRSGYRVVETDTAGEARRILRDEAVDLAVLDVHLPDGTGLDVTRDVRADPERAGTPIVHVSAVAVETTDKVAGLDGGADAYFVDPIEPEELLSTIRALLRSSGARRDAEGLARRMSHLNRAAVRVNVAATIARLTDAVAGAVAEVLEQPAVAVLVEEQGARLSAAAPNGVVDESSFLTAAEAGPLLESLTAGATVHGGEAPWTRVLPYSTAGDWRIWPVATSHESVGLLAVPVSGNQSGDDFLLGRLAQVAAVALDNLRALEREHQTAHILQRSLLPMALPRPPGIAIAARYRASESHAEVGGDFFDAFEIDGRCFVAIGDVQGHSLEAAVVMAELRYSMRAYAYDGYGPAEIVDRIDGVLVRNEPGLIATVCIGVISSDRRTMRVCNAGHTPMVLVRDDEPTVVQLRGILLGLGMAHTEHDVELRPRDRLLFLTDGLVERRALSLDVTLQELAAGFAAMPESDVEEAADRLIDEFGASDDDVALMIVDMLEDDGPRPH